MGAKLLGLACRTGSATGYLLAGGFEVNRPRALWGGFCVTAACRDDATIDLMFTRAYSRVPSARHLDELQRICWSLEEAAKQAGSTA
jgi:hypothetical protein